MGPVAHQSVGSRTQRRHVLRGFLVGPILGHAVPFPRHDSERGSARSVQDRHQIAPELASPTSIRSHAIRSGARQLVAIEFPAGLTRSILRVRPSIGPPQAALKTETGVLIATGKEAAQTPRRSDSSSGMWGTRPSSERVALPQRIRNPTSCATGSRTQTRMPGVG